MIYKTRDQAIYKPGDVLVHFTNNEPDEHNFKIKILAIAERNYVAVILENVSGRLVGDKSLYSIGTVDTIFKKIINYNKIWNALNVL